MSSTILLAVVLTACGGAPGPDEPVSSDDPTPPATTPGTAPDDWIRGAVFIASADILILESFPIQVRLAVTGDLPTPCHVPVWNIDDDGETITVVLESAIALGQDCAQVLEPFDISVALGSFAEGARTVILNGGVVGDFTT